MATPSPLVLLGFDQNRCEYFCFTFTVWSAIIFNNQKCMCDANLEEANHKDTGMSILSTIYVYFKWLQV